VSVLSSSQQGDILLPQAAQELLLNMSIGNVDMSIPNMFHYLPHLIGKPDAIKPSLKYSQGRNGGTIDYTYPINCSIFVTPLALHLLCITNQRGLFSLVVPYSEIMHKKMYSIKEK